MASGAIFLSASVPDERRSPALAETADVVAITSAVAALVQVILGRRRLVWGGHPAITPIIQVVADSMKVDYAEWVHLYQSSFFSGTFPEENARFPNVTYTEAALGRRDQSLLIMRKQMFSSTVFESAVFIGGMEGIVDEFALFSERQPEARCIPIYSTGGATLLLAEKMQQDDPALWYELDYITLLHDKLRVSIRERRYRAPADQPERVEERFRDHKSM